MNRDDASPARLHTEALTLESRGDLEGAASLLDRAFGLDSGSAPIRHARAELLNRLSVVEHGLVFRYVPAGTFLMGADDGEPDERPVHPVDLGAFWISDVPITWAAYCRLMGWSPPPEGMPPVSPEQGEGGFDRERFYRSQETKIRLQYCESRTTGARDWHAHLPDTEWTAGDGSVTTSREMFGEVPREGGVEERTYDVKPMVAVAWGDAAALGARLSQPGTVYRAASTVYRLPTEAEWEKAARGGLLGKRYPWGDDPPTAGLCDHGRFGLLAMEPPRRFPPNGYGLFGMAGGVWEWTADDYDARAYAEGTAGAGGGGHKVLRGGSWADCAAAVRVSFRMSLPASEGGHGWGAHMTPNVGFRLVRERRG